MSFHMKSALLALPFLLCCGVVLAAAVVVRGGDWPDAWPGELETFRHRAETWLFSAGSQANIYRIPFRSRREFERTWPVLLKLKSKGAPLVLHEVDEPKSDPEDNRVRFTEPQVEITCPTQGTYRREQDGSYSHEGPWTADLGLSSGDVLPEFVGFSKTDNKWVAVDLERLSPEERIESLKSLGQLERATVELTLFIDGTIIDLNRIPLPSDTPIVDRRGLF